MSLQHKFVVVTDMNFSAVGLRFCQQVQENSKCEAFLNELPEANHNAIESYYGQSDSNFLFIRDNYNKRLNARFDFLKNLLEMRGNKVVEIEAPNYSLSSIFNLIYRLDWLSLYIARNKDVNPMEVNNIKSLKEYLELV